MFRDITLKSVFIVLLGSFILAFGLFNVHSFSNVTEGGGLGLTLLLQHWFQISPSITSFLFNAICYLTAWKILGKSFLIYSVISSVGFSIFYSLVERMGPFFPEIGNYPLLASVLGALFVGIGCGLCVRVGGAPSGDDALAMNLSKLLKVKIQWVYLCSDLIVLGLSITYIPFTRIFYSLLTVILSGQLIGFVQNYSHTAKKEVSD